MSSITDLNDFFSKISAPSSSGGLSITVHPLTQPLEYPGADPARVIAEDQNAVRIEEMEDGLELPITKDTQIDLGETTPGTPNTAGRIAIFTKRIKQYICDLCGGDPQESGACNDSENFHSSNCRSSANASVYGDTLVGAYTNYVNHHEIGHSLYLVDPETDPDAYIYPWHHAPGDETLYMTPSVTYTKKGKKVTFFLPDTYCSSCFTYKKLK
jgi:hypothetical protein